MHIHILGICGTFMGGAAALARALGHTVTGCDAGVYPPMSDQLRTLGIDLIEGFGAEQLRLAPDLFVVGNVVSRQRLPGGGAKFPLMEAIMDARLPYVSGPQWLAENVLQGRWTLAVAGTHGKTTTTSMLAWILHCAGRNPGFLVGGAPLGFDASAQLGAADAPFVIEADEYDTAFFDKRSKFVHYRPYTALLGNLEFDHADIFEDLAAIERQFHHLVRTVPEGGRIVYNADSQALARVLEQGCWSSRVSFGSAPGAQLRAEGKPDDFSVVRGGEALARVTWNLAGEHNRLNALGALAAAEHAGVDIASACAHLSTFKGVRRRLEEIGQAVLPQGSLQPVTVFDDFAHHPSAIRTTVSGLRERMDAIGPAGNRLLAVFEPRSNTMKLGSMKAQLPWALQQADLVFCYAGGLDWDAASALAPLGEKAFVAQTTEELIALVAQRARSGDHILCMSNGGFDGVPRKLLRRLEG